MRKEHQGSQIGMPQLGVLLIRGALIVFSKEDNGDIGDDTSRHTQSNKYANRKSKNVERQNNMERKCNERKHKQIGH